MSYNKKTGRYEGYIYQITNKLNGKVYIGQTSRTIDIRWKQHVHATEWHIRPTYVDRDIAKFGEKNFDIEWLAMVNAETEESLHDILNDLEREYIARNDCLYKTNKQHGYNITEGGDPQISNKLPVDVYDIHGKLIAQYDSRNEASDKMNICLTSVIHCCQGRISNVDCKYVFRNKGEAFDKYDPTNHYRYRNIYQFDLEGNLIALYHSKGEIPYDYRSNIHMVLDNPIKTFHGFWWGTTDKFLYEGNPKYKAVDVYDKDKNLICTYKNIAECARQLNVNICTVQDCCYGKSIMCKSKYYLRFHNEPLDKYRLERIKKQSSRKIGKYTLDDELIEIYDSMVAAAKSLNINHSSKISQCCNNKQKQAYGYKWKFI